MKRGDRRIGIHGTLHPHSATFLTGAPRRTETETAWFGSREIQITGRAAETRAEEFLRPLTVCFMTDDARAVTFSTGQIDRFAQSRFNTVLHDNPIDNRFDRVRFSRRERTGFCDIHEFAINSCSHKSVASNPIQYIPMSAPPPAHHG